MNPFLRRGSLAFVLLVFAVAGCTTKHYRNSADLAAYSSIQVKSTKVQNMDPHFTIQQTNELSLELFPVNTNVCDFLGNDAEAERGARVLALDDALAVAVKSSRNYQSRKEDLYLSALSVTLARHQFAPIFSADGAVGYEATDLDSVTDPNHFRGTANVSGSWLIRDLGRITAAFTADAVRFVSGDQRVFTSSQLSATFVRPLLRNAGYKAQIEILIQAERQLLYDIRDFTRFREDFTVQVASSYYGVLGSRDAVRNSFLNLQTSRKNAERSRALGQEGRVTQSDLGRLEQQELTTEGTWINAVSNYKQSLDNFKLLLGLPVSANVMLDDHELQKLKIEHPNLQVDESIQVALAARLDYFNVKDELEDSDRKVALAANFLKPQLDLAANVNVQNNAHINYFPVPDPRHYQWSAGFNYDLGLDRVPERNAYRSSLIARDRAARAVAQQEDDIRLQVRDSWRTLDQAKRSYEISEIGVKLAERRVEEQNLLAELGRAKAQDQVDAQNDLITSKNQLTQALVTHTISRLQFWNRLGILYVKENGQWEEIQHADAK